MTTYFLPQKHPKILLINFSTDDQRTLVERGYNVELGLVARPTTTQRGVIWEYYFESPPYEYDIIIYTSDAPLVRRGTFPRLYDRNKDDKDFWELEQTVETGFGLSFIGSEKERENDLSSGGLPFVKLVDADVRDTSLSLVSPGESGIKEIHLLIAKYRSRISKVTQYVDKTSFRSNSPKTPLIVNTRNDWVGFCETGMEGGKLYPKYLVLPQFERNTEVVLDILDSLIDVRPRLFPGITKLDWLESDEFIPDEVKAIEEEIRQEERRVKDFRKQKEKEKGKIARKLKFLIQILLADDEHFEGGERLKTNVKKVLEFLGFSVVDRDLQIKRGKKREDLIISEKDWNALVEVRGTRRENPPEHFYSDLLKHLVKAKGTGHPKGLLIVNYDTSRHPFRRTEIYKDAPELLKDEDGVVGVLSTVELYRIAMAVKRGEMKKEDARNKVKKTGRITLKPKDFMNLRK